MLYCIYCAAKHQQNHRVTRIVVSYLEQMELDMYYKSASQLKMILYGAQDHDIIFYVLCDLNKL